MLLPSKELLSEVLGCNIKDIYKINSNPNFGNNELVYSISGVGDILSINTYELAHKCKEWAKLKYFIDIDSHSGCARWGAEAVSHNGRPSVFYEQVFIGRTETDAIFKACEWIMEQKQND